MKKYHQSLGIPTDMIREFTGLLGLYYGPHAMAAAAGDRILGKAATFLPRKINVRPEDVVEIEEEDGKPVKAVIRLPWVGDKDMCVVVNAKSEKPLRFVRTVWWNRKADSHKTLRKGEYCGCNN